MALCLAPLTVFLSIRVETLATALSGSRPLQGRVHGVLCRLLASSGARQKVAYIDNHTCT